MKRKIPRQPTDAVSMPPRTAQGETEIDAGHGDPERTAETSRWIDGGEDRRAGAEDLGPPTPCSSRRAISTPPESATAQRSVATGKTVNPVMKTRRRPTAPNAGFRSQRPRLESAGAALLRAPERRHLIGDGIPVVAHHGRPGSIHSLHDQDGNWRMCKSALGHAAKQCSRETSGAPGSHHDDIGAVG